ncbi:MAG: c-type cytochrome [Verrucomicrobia bacterium]|nr:c-type cytochrome [Deltaproteobacteria bacterium]
MRNISKGENLFRTRCGACHTIGAKAAAGTKMRPIGPGLADPLDEGAGQDAGGERTAGHGSAGRIQRGADAQPAAEHDRYPGSVRIYRGREPPGGASQSWRSQTPSALMCRD